MSDSERIRNPDLRAQVERALAAQQRVFDAGMEEAMRATRRQLEEVNRMVREQLEMSSRTATEAGASLPPAADRQAADHFQLAEQWMATQPAADPVANPTGPAPADPSPRAASAASAAGADPMVHAKTVMDDATEALQASLEALMTAVRDRDQS